MTTFPTTCRTQIENAYVRMADEARYRPQAPSDGFGNITVPLEDLDLEDEARRYAERWWREEDEGDFVIGLANYSTRPAMIFALEAARCTCSGTADDVALRLLRMAVAELRKARKR